MHSWWNWNTHSIKDATLRHEGSIPSECTPAWWNGIHAAFRMQSSDPGSNPGAGTQAYPNWQRKLAQTQFMCGFEYRRLH